MFNHAIPTIQAELSWLQKHERLIVTVLVLLALAWGTSRTLGYLSNQANARATAAEKALEVAKASDAENRARTAQVQSEYEMIVTALQKQNASLAAAVASRQVLLAQNQEENKHLKLPDLAKKWQTLANVQDSDISASEAGITLNSAGAVATVNTLERVPVLEADKKDLQQVASNTKQELDKANVVITAQSIEIAGLQDVQSKSNTAHKAEIAAVKAEARKGKVKWFKIGFVVGFVTGAYVGHLIP
jgi:hypothetical protein